MVPKEPIAFISCEFSVAKGSAIIFTCVLAPRPAMASNAATFMFVGNPLTASTALPSKIVIGFFIDKRSVLDSITNGADASDAVEGSYKRD